MSTDNNEVTPQEKAEIEQEFIKNCISPYLEERKEMKEPKIDWATYTIFNYFWKYKMIKINEKEVKKYKKEANERWLKQLKQRRAEGERIKLDTAMGNRTAQMYAACIALYYKIDEIKTAIEINEKA